MKIKYSSENQKILNSKAFQNVLKRHINSFGLWDRRRYGGYTINNLKSFCDFLNKKGYYTYIGISFYNIFNNKKEYEEYMNGKVRTRTP